MIMTSIRSILVTLFLASGMAGANATTLEPADFNTFPVSVNALNIGDSGSQHVATPMSHLDGYGYLLNIYYLTSSASAYFNYTIDYFPASSAFAEARIWTGDLDPNTGFTSNGQFLAQSGQVSTDPSNPATITGSFLMDAGLTYALIAGLYSGQPEPNGSYDLAWAFSATAASPDILSVNGGGTETPLPATLPLFAAGIGLMRLLQKRCGLDS